MIHEIFGLCSTHDRKMGTPFDCKTLLSHYASASKSIDDNRADLVSLRLPGSEPLVSVQVEMRSTESGNKQIGILVDGISFFQYS